MSSGKQFEKTFSREKENDTKKSNENKKKKDEGEKGKKKNNKYHPVPTDLIVPSSSTESQQQHKPNEVNGKIEGRKSASNTKKKVKSTPQKPDKQKNGDVSNSKQKHKQQNQEKQVKSTPQKPEKQKVKRQLKDGESDEAEKKKKKQKKNDNKSTEKKAEDESDMVESAECTFPMNRIARIIKSEGSDYRITQEAIFIINKATEKFIEVFCEDSYNCAVQDRRNSIGYKQLSTVVSKEDRFEFISDVVPQKVKAERALAERKASKK